MHCNGPLTQVYNVIILKYHNDQDHSVSDPAKNKTVVPSSFSLVQPSLQFLLDFETEP